MNFVTHRISLDIHDTSSQVLLRVKHGETSRKLHITLRESGQPYEIADGCTANLSAIKPDGNSIYNHCEIEGNTITYTFTEQTTMAVGMMDCEIVLLGGDEKRITAPRFSILVEEGLFSGDEIISSPEATALDELIDRTTVATEAAENVVGDIKKYAGDNFANAFDGYAEGTAIRVDDVSPMEHTVQVRVHGKNLIDISTATPLGSETVEINGDDIILKNFGVGHYGCRFIGIHLSVGKTYTFSVESVSEKTDGFGWRIMYEDGSSTGASKSNTLTITIDKKVKWVNFYIAFGDFTTVQDIIISKPMCEVADTATEYEPWLDPTTVTVTEETTGATYTPNTFGTCDIVSVSPTMTLTSDNEKAIIELEYNKDSNKVVQELYDFVVQETSSVTKVSSVKLLANKWVGSASPYSQVVSIAGITENSMVDLTPSVEQLAVFYNKDLAFVTENVDGVVTVYAIGQKPANDYTIQVAITEVKD